MSTVVSNTSVFTNREFPFKKITLSDSLEKRNRKYYIDYDIEDQPIFFQINKVVLSSEPIFIDEEQGYIDVEVKERIGEISKFFLELDNFNQVSCFKNSEEWLGKSLTMQEVESVYKGSFKNNLLRVKIEKDNISIFDSKKNKLDLEKDIKVGNILDIIVEISGLKVMKNSFATHLVLRQIRKNPDPIVKAKIIPNGYLFLDDYSGKKVQDDKSIDSQTDVDILVKRRKQITRPVAANPTKAAKAEKAEKAEKLAKSEDQTVDVDELDISVSELKDPEEHEETEATLETLEKSKTVDADTPSIVSTNGKKRGKVITEPKEEAKEESKESFDIEKDDLNTKDYLQSVEKLNSIINNIFDEDNSRKDNILNQLEAGEITLGSMNSEKSEKVPTKKANGRKKGGAKGKTATNQLYKNL
jgi:hypothetical protein